MNNIQIDQVDLTSLETVCRSYGFMETAGALVYTEMFKIWEDTLVQHKGDTTKTGQASPIMYLRNNDEDRGHYRLVFPETLDEQIEEAFNYDFAIMNGLTYFGRKNKLEWAEHMYAMIFDLDDVTPTNLLNFLNAAYVGHVYPIPNYIVLSGHGCHLYYLFEYPIELYPNIKLQLKELKFALTDLIWNRYTSSNPDIQHQGINQAFRVINSKNKMGQMTIAFKTNAERYSVSELCDYVPLTATWDETKLYAENKMTLAQAKEKWPDWYERIVVRKEGRKYWKVNRALYDWWLKQIMVRASVGHRYFCIMALAIYAIKCEIPFDKLKNDAYMLQPMMNSMNANQPFTIKDVDAALECYDVRYKTFPAKDIEKLTKIPMRHHQKHMPQNKHLLLARMNKKPENFQNAGRKSKEQIVKEWRDAHPNGKKADCIKDTGLTKPTVYKWW